MRRPFGSAAALVIAATLLWHLFLTSALAQGVPNEYRIGFPEHGDFSGSDFESVQLNNNNLHIELPLWTLPGRGQSVGVKYIYDSHGWGFNEHCGVRTGTCTDTATPTPGLHNVGPNWNHLTLTPVSLSGYTVNETTSSYTCSGTATVITSSFSVRTPDGSTHHFAPDPVQRPGQVGTCFSWPTTLYTDDGSGFALDLNSGALKTKDGTIAASGALTDSNGNQIIFGTPASDTLGRPFNTDGNYYDSAGVLRTISIVKQNVAVQTNICAFSSGDFCNEYSSTWYVPTTFTLPNGQSYSFTYDQGSPTHPYYGQPLSVTLPTGGQIIWGWNGEDIPGPKLVSRQLSGDPQPWRYAGLTVTDPAGNDTVNTCAWYDPPYALLGGDPLCYIITKKYYQGSSTSGTLIKTVQTDYWTTNEPAILPIRETTTWNQQNLVSKVEMDYDSWFASTSYNGLQTFNATAGNVIEKREFGYGTGAPGSQVRTTDSGYLHLSNSTYRGLNILDKVTSTKTYAGTSQTGTLTAQILNTYDGVAIPTAGNTSGVPAPNHDYTNFPASYNLRGNLTQVSRGLKVGATWTWLNTNNTYNDLGEVLTSTDPGGHPTSYDYTDSWASISNPQCVTSAHSYGFPTTITDALSHRTKHTYYSCTSLTGSTQDENDIVASRPGTAYSYDLLSRTTAVNAPDGGQTTFSYNDAVPYTKTSTQVITTSPTTLNKVSTTVFDGLGRVQQTQLVDPDCSSGPVKVDYTYSYDSAPPSGIPAGRFATVSNPYCTTSDPTYGITKTRYDALDRPVRVIPPDGSDSANNVSTTYSGTTAGLTTTVADQAGVSRKSQTDALGRLTAVWEDPSVANYETDYSYDERDNLTGVTQKGGASSSSWRNRSFQYDSLSRLTQAINPESGTINYSYDADSNLFQKIAPQANQTGSATTTTTFCYDQVHRLTGKAYTALTCPLTTPPVQFLYDQASYNGLTITNGIGRRTGMSDGSGIAAWSFDSMGRPLAERRTLNTSITKSFTFSYYKDGEMQQTVWPGGHQVTYAPNAAGRSLSAIGTAYNYVTAATYTPQGGLSSSVMGFTSGFNGLTIANTYNKRLQPSAITASKPDSTLIQSLTYDFHLNTGDNGNVFKITNGKDANRTQNFTYDALNRIKSAATQGTTGATCWGQLFGHMSGSTFVPGIDPWGNLTEITNSQSGCSTLTLSQSITTKNQFAAPFVHDAAGNLTNDGAHPFTYDTENRLATAGGVTYTYDGDGKRVKKSNGTLYWTGPGWDPLLETDLSGNATAEYVFFNGKRVARVDMPGNSPKYYFEDRLGSTDIVTNPTGGIVEESDYVPYGGEVVINGSDPNHFKFTGKERDLESGLDYFDARHYSSPFGRFMTPDWAATATAVPYANFGNPQSLNLYSYVQNNPTTMGDPDGHATDVGTAIQIGEFIVNEVVPETKAAASKLGPKLLGIGGKAVGVVGSILSSPLTLNEGEDSDVANRMEEQAAADEKANEEEDPPQASSDGARQGNGNNGTIYKVPGAATSSGKPYIGRHNQPDPAKTRKSKDGRDRTKAKVVDTYNAKNTQEGRVKEQKQIDKHGLKNLDNKRDEIRKTKKKKSS